MTTFSRKWSSFNRVQSTVQSTSPEDMAQLSLNELKLILSEVSSICDKWYCIGFELDLPVDYLEDLDTQLSDKKIDVGSCLRKVLVEWIKTNQATWPTLTKALSGDLVKEEGLASVLQRKYSGSSLGEHTHSLENQTTPFCRTSGSGLVLLLLQHQSRIP